MSDLDFIGQGALSGGAAGDSGTDGADQIDPSLQQDTSGAVPNSTPAVDPSQGAAPQDPTGGLDIASVRPNSPMPEDIQNDTLNLGKNGLAAMNKMVLTAKNNVGLSPQLATSVNRVRDLSERTAKDYEDVANKAMKLDMDVPNLLGSDQDVKDNLNNVKQFQAQKLQEMESIKQKVAEGSLDPNRFWHNQGAAGQVLGMISVALGTYGSSLTHSPNVAMDIINKAMDRDWEAQQGDLNRLYKLHQMTADENNQFNANQDHALNLTTGSQKLMIEDRMQKLTGLIAQVEPMAKALGASEKGLQAQELLQKLKTEQVNAAATAGNLAGKAFDEFKSSYNGSLAGGGKPLSPAAQKEFDAYGKTLESLNGLDSMLKDPKTASQIGSRQAIAPNRIKGGELFDSSNVADILHGQMPKGVRGFLSRHPNDAADLEESQNTNPDLTKLHGAYTDAQMSLDSMANGLRMTPAAKEAFKNLVGSPALKDVGTAQQALQRTRDSLKEKMKASIMSYAAAGEDVRGMVKLYQQHFGDSAQQQLQKPSTIPDALWNKANPETRKALLQRIQK